MEKKEVLEYRLAEISKDIREIKEEAMWIRNKMLQLWQIPFNEYNQCLKLNERG